jgi:hypothetical protein
MARVMSFEDYCQHYELDPEDPFSQDQYDGFIHAVEAPE